MLALAHAHTCGHHLARMVESCQAFIDFEHVSSHPMSEYVFEQLR